MQRPIIPCVGRRLALAVGAVVTGAASVVAQASARGDVRFPRAVERAPITLVSRAGFQPGSDLNASACPPQHGCSSIAIFHPLNPAPRVLSIVRPGELVQILGLHQDGHAAAFVQTLPRRCDAVSRQVAYVSQRRWLRGQRFIPMPPTGVWNVDLQPGFYVLSVSFSFPARRGGGSVVETGLFGLAVSASEPLRIVRRRPCQS